MNADHSIYNRIDRNKGPFQGSPSPVPAGGARSPATPIHDPVPVLHTDALTETFVRPPGKTYLLYGDNLVFQLSLTMAAHALTSGASVAVVDGGNQFNVHLISRFARERAIDPSALLNRIFVSRGFTCYQMEQAVADRLPSFLKTIGSQTAMIFGLLDTFYDEQAPLREVRQILKRMLIVLQAMKAEGTSVLVACLDRTIWPEERNQLFTTLKAGMDRVYRLEVDQEQRPHVLLERAGSPLAHQAGEIGVRSRLHGGKGEPSHGAHSTDVYKPY